jgi:hypothetical protein
MIRARGRLIFIYQASDQKGRPNRPKLPRFTFSFYLGMLRRPDGGFRDDNLFSWLDLHALGIELEGVD